MRTAAAVCIMVMVAGCSASPIGQVDEIRRGVVCEPVAMEDGAAVLDSRLNIGNATLVATANDTVPNGSDTINFTSAGGPSVARFNGSEVVALRQRYADGGGRRGEDIELYVNSSDGWARGAAVDLGNETKSLEGTELTVEDGMLVLYFSWVGEGTGWTVSRVSGESIKTVANELRNKSTWRHVAGGMVDGGVDSAKDPSISGGDENRYMVVTVLGNGPVLLKETAPGFSDTAVVGRFAENIPATKISNTGEVIRAGGGYSYLFNWVAERGGRWRLGVVTAGSIEGLPAGEMAGFAYNDEHLRYFDYENETLVAEGGRGRVYSTYKWRYDGCGVH